MSKDFNIQEIAKLALIELNSEEQSKLSKDLSIILEHVDALSSLSIDDSNLRIHPLGIELELREDTAEEGLSHEESMKNAPDDKDGFFQVPPSMD